MTDEDPAADLLPRQDETGWVCMGDGRTWSTRERAMACPCGAGLRALHAGAVSTMVVMQGVVDRASAVLGAVIDHARPPDGKTPSLAALAAQVESQQRVLDQQKDALDELTLAQLAGALDADLADLAARQETQQRALDEQRHALDELTLAQLAAALGPDVGGGLDAEGDL